MISDSFDLFSAEVHFILKHIEIIKLQEEHVRELDLKTNADKTGKEKAFLGVYNTYRTKEKQMNYTSNVIFLYGIFEQFVESSIKEYIEELCSFVPRYDDLDDVIKNNYLNLWTQFLPKLGWAKFSGLNHNILVKNLYETLNEKRNNILFQLFLRNGGNYNHSSVSDLMNNIINSSFKENIVKYDPLKRYFVRRGMIGYNVENLLSPLNDFVESRNDIAHNGKAINMLADDEFRKTIHFIHKYAKSLTLFLNDNILRKKWEIHVKNQDKKILKTNHYWPRIRTVSFVSDEVLVFINQEVVIKQSKDRFPQYVKAKVIEIHQKQAENNIRFVDEILSTETIEFSVKFDVKVSAKSEFIFL